ncbi:hypothetical protein JKF63_06857 [Porcisia hertigi]|uniref:Tyrosine specific protein phosphatases domain-containing protein n=1 Tax=Porcisia hertigi TaxID=2761500 RepID=A0A836LJ91_9TRYP|nr:hypothetical protein JKF63_06857 [Porcisia hertigi]
MIPGVYLGSWNDVGTDILKLARRISDASTGTHESPPSASSCSRQHLALLVRACPLKGCVAPRLELHVTRHRKRVRRSLLSTGETDDSLPAAASRIAHPPQQPSQKRFATLKVQRGGATRSLAPAEEDVVVSHMSLSDVHKLVWAAAAAAAAAASPSATDPVLAPGATSSGISAVAKWLSPDSPPSSPLGSVSTSGRPAGDVPVGCTPADWQAFVGAIQCLLMESVSAHTRNGPAFENEDSVEGGEASNDCLSEPAKATAVGFHYWRLVLPILDSPGTRMQHYTPMTSLVMHAALTLDQHPQGRAWLQGQQRKAASSNTPANKARATANVAAEEGACGSVNVCAARSEAATAAAAAVYPCVAVHCQAGKSRSVTFVAAFLMHQWMWWCRGCHSLATADVRTTASKQELQRRNRDGSIARRLVDTVLSHLRRRRLCVDINLGFDTQLWEMMCSFLASL